MPRITRIPAAGFDAASIQFQGRELRAISPDELASAAARFWFGNDSVATEMARRESAAALLARLMPIGEGRDLADITYISEADLYTPIAEGLYGAESAIAERERRSAQFVAMLPLMTDTELRAMAQSAPRLSLERLRMIDAELAQRMARRDVLLSAVSPDTFACVECGDTHPFVQRYPARRAGIRQPAYVCAFCYVRGDGSPAEVMTPTSESASVADATPRCFYCGVHQSDAGPRVEIDGQWLCQDCVFTCADCEDVCSTNAGYELQRRGGTGRRVAVIHICGDCRDNGDYAECARCGDLCDSGAMRITEELNGDESLRCIPCHRDAENECRSESDDDDDERGRPFHSGISQRKKRGLHQYNVAVVTDA